MKLKEGIIYKITNIINHKVYIGQTVNTLKNRWNKHCHSSGCRILYNAILKYGKDTFTQEVIEEIPIEKLDEREIYWISFYKSNEKTFGYNILQGGNLGRKGFSKLSKDDIMMFNYLKHYQIPVTIVATKIDKVGVTQHQKQRNMILNELELPVGDEFVMFSNITKEGRSEIYDRIERII